MLYFQITKDIAPLPTRNPKRCGNVNGEGVQKFCLYQHKEAGSLEAGEYQVDEICQYLDTGDDDPPPVRGYRKYRFYEGSSVFE